MTRFHFERPDGNPTNAQNILIHLNEFVPPQGFIPGEKIVGGAIFKSVEKIEFTIPVSTLSNSGTLTKGQIDTKCVPFTTVATPRNTEERLDTRFVNVTISGTTVTATRESASSNTFVDVIIFVVEFTDACTVQTGEETIANSSFTATATISALTDLTKSFVYITPSTTNTLDDLNDSYVTVEITNTTTLTFTRTGSQDAVICRWYTVECDNTQFDVQRGQFSIPASNDNNAQSAAFTAVDMDRTMVIANYNTTEVGDDGEAGNCTIDLVDSTHVRARRANGNTPAASRAINIDFQVIQFGSAENITVQRGEFLMSGVEDTDTINDVNLDGSMAHSPSGQNNASINSQNGDDIGQFFCKMDLQDSITVRGRVITDSTETVNSWEVVEWLQAPVVLMGFEDSDIMEYEDDNIMVYE